MRPTQQHLLPGDGQLCDEMVLIRWWQQAGGRRIQDGDIQSSAIYRQPVDPVVGDPVRQDNDKIWILGSFIPSFCIL